MGQSPIASGMATASGGCPVPTIMSTYYGNDGNTLREDATFTFEGPGQGPGTEVDVSPTQVVAIFSTTSGTAVSVFDKSLNLLGSFYLTSLSNCSSASAGGGTVLYDSISSRWVLLDKAASSPNVTCLYVSNDNAADILTATFTPYSYDFSPHVPLYPRLGLWPRVYHLTVSKAPLFPGDVPHHLCVINRANPSQIFCAAPYNGLLAGFAQQTLQSWTPAHGVPSTAIESAGTGGIGALFMRPIDDELQYGSTITPNTDQIEVEHWTNIQFGPAFTANYTAIRYKISVADFNSSTFGGAPTPQGNFLDRQTPFLMHRLLYQNGKLTASLSSANGSALWFELAWGPPAPMQPDKWLLSQQGSIDNAFLPAIASDANGNMVMSYAKSSETTYLSFSARGRYGSDLAGRMRPDELLLEGGDLGSPTITASSVSSIAYDHSAGRTFFTAGQVASATSSWRAVISKVTLNSQTIVREWKAIDACNNFVTCNQTFLTA